MDGCDSFEPGCMRRSHCRRCGLSRAAHGSPNTPLQDISKEVKTSKQVAVAWVAPQPHAAIPAQDASTAPASGAGLDSAVPAKLIRVAPVEIKPKPAAPSSAGVAVAVNGELLEALR
jgi:hypothetical protein